MVSSVLCFLHLMHEFSQTHADTPHTETQLQTMLLYYYNVIFTSNWCRFPAPEGNHSAVFLQEVCQILPSHLQSLSINRNS